MLLLKIRNAAELCWDSLDGEERRMLLLAGCWLLGVVLLGLQGRAQEIRRQNTLAMIEEVLDARQGR